MIHSIRRVSLFALVPVTAVCLAACGLGTAEATDAATAQLTSDGQEAISSNQQLTAFNSDAFNVNVSDPAMAATQYAGPVSHAPAACETRTKDATDPKVVHVHFNDCTGPFGLLHLSGDETAVFSANPDGTLHVQVSDDGDLTVNGKAVHHSASGDITINGALRSVAWKGAWNREDALGITVSHTTDLQIAVDTTAGCSTTNGTAVTDIGAREIDSKLENVKVCKNAAGVVTCPSGTVVHTGKASGKSITVDFDGSATAAVTGIDGKTRDVALVCTP